MCAMSTLDYIEFLILSGVLLAAVELLTTELVKSIVEYFAVKKEIANGISKNSDSSSVSMH